MSQPHITKKPELTTYITKDNSSICELMHPQHHASNNQSLARASVTINSETQLHYHATTEELYHILQGEGLITLGTEQYPVAEGDTICIPPDTKHKIKNTGTITLEFLCCCSPAYSHDDTFLIDD